jgi:hypothetical protein
VATVSDPGSVLEGFERELVGELGKEGLDGGFAAPEGVEAKGFGVQIDFATNEAVNPKRVNAEEMPKQPDLAVVIGASKEDDLAHRRSLKVLMPGAREGSSRRSDQDAFGSTSSGGGDEPGGLILERFQGVVVKASPDLGLPAAVVAFDGGLEAGLARRREDRSHLEGEADPADTTEVIGIVMSTLEPGVVVELNVTGKTELAPVLDQSRHTGPRGDRGSGPGSRQGTVKRDGVKDFHIDSAFNDKAFDDVEAIGLELSGSDLGQVPAAWRAWPAHPWVAIQSSSSFQDSANRANRRDPAVSLPAQLPVDGDITVLSQVACLPKLLAQLQDFLFDIRRDTVGGLAGRSRGTVGPVDAFQAFSFSPAHPAVHRRVAQPKGPGDRPQRTTPADGRNHGPTKPLNRVFLRSWPLLSGRRADHSPRVEQNPFRVAGQGHGPMEAAGVWKAAEYGVFPHPSENASRFPQLPQAQLLLHVLERT